jgi:hypothetical protein
MKLAINLLCTATTLSVLAAAPLNPVARQVLAQRKFQPEDLFRVRHISAIAWSADGVHAAIQLTKPDRALGSVVSNEIALLDVKSRALRTLSSNVSKYFGFFNPMWSLHGRRLAFLSVDANASIQAWI